VQDNLLFCILQVATSPSISRWFRRGRRIRIAIASNQQAVDDILAGKTLPRKVDESAKKPA
jgi:hypothetical protein